MLPVVVIVVAIVVLAVVVTPENSLTMVTSLRILGGLPVSDSHMHLHIACTVNPNCDLMQM